MPLLDVFVRLLVLVYKLGCRAMYVTVLLNTLCHVKFPMTNCTSHCHQVGHDHREHDGLTCVRLRLSNMCG